MLHAVGGCEWWAPRPNKKAHSTLFEMPEGMYAVFRSSLANEHLESVAGPIHAV